MIILNKIVDSITDAVDCMKDKEGLEEYNNVIESEIKYFLPKEFNYQDVVNIALDRCKIKIPSPFSSMYPNCYGLNLGNDFFTFRIPNSIGFGIRVFPSKKGIRYEVSVVIYNNRCFVEESDGYKALIADGWKVKER